MELLGNLRDKVAKSKSIVHFFPAKRRKNFLKELLSQADILL